MSTRYPDAALATYDRLRRAITLRGTYQYGDRALGVRELCAHFELTRRQAAQVLDALERDGLIGRAQGAAPTVLYRRPRALADSGPAVRPGGRPPVRPDI